MFNPFKINKLFVPVVVGITFAATPALAGFEVSSPSVEKGEAEVEYNGFVESGLPDSSEGDTNHGHEIELKVGITDWLRLGVGFEFEEEAGEDFDFAGVEIGALIVLMDKDKAGFGFGLEFGIEAEKGEDGEEGEKEYFIGALAEFDLTDNFVTTLNASFNRPFRDYEDEDAEWGFSYAYKIAYEFSDSLALGIEGYGEQPELGESENLHRIGPVIYYSLGEGEENEAKGDDDDDDEEEEGMEIGFQLGVLFGVTDETPDTTVKFGIEMEF